jgi:hypothetical protein
MDRGPRRRLESNPVAPQKPNIDDKQVTTLWFSRLNSGTLGMPVEIKTYNQQLPAIKADVETLLLPNALL